MFHFLTDALYSEDFALGSVSTYILDIPVGCTTAKDRVKSVCVRARDTFYLPT